MKDPGVIEVSRHPGVSVRRQIAARIEAAVREGELMPGERLPDVRCMARSLGVHRNTVWAAYRELAERGHVRSVRGHGVFVREVAPAPLEDRFRCYLAAERATGGTAWSVEARFRDWSVVLRARRLRVVEEEAGLRRLLKAEVRRALGSRWAVAGCSLSVALRNPERLEGCIPVGRPSVCARLRGRLPPWMELLSLPLRGGSGELRNIARIRGPAVVTVMTVSRSVRRHARELLAGWTGRGLSLATPRPRAANEVARAKRISALIYADAVCQSHPTLTECPRVVGFRCVKAEALEEIARYLGPGRGSRRFESGLPVGGAVEPIAGT